MKTMLLFAAASADGLVALLFVVALAAWTMRQYERPLRWIRLPRRPSLAKHGPRPFSKPPVSPPEKLAA